MRSFYIIITAIRFSQVFNLFFIHLITFVTTYSILLFIILSFT